MSLHSYAGFTEVIDVFRACRTVPENLLQNLRRLLRDVGPIAATDLHHARQCKGLQSLAHRRAANLEKLAKVRFRVNFFLWLPLALRDHRRYLFADMLAQGCARSADRQRPVRSWRFSFGKLNHIHRTTPFLTWESALDNL